MLHLALMSSENRAAHALGRNYPGRPGRLRRGDEPQGAALGMSDTRYVEPTGLSSQNQSSASDLAALVEAAYEHPIIRELSTSPRGAGAMSATAQLQFRNTNGLVRNPEWDIGLQKTGYISEAGRCLVMQAQLAGRKLIMVLLDSAGKYSRIGDAERVRKWLDQSALPAPAPSRVGRVLTPIAAAAPAARRSARGGPAPPRSAPRWPCRRSSQPSSSRSAGAEIDRPATSLPWSSKMPAAMQRTPSSSSSSSRAVPQLAHAGQFALQRRQCR